MARPTAAAVHGAWLDPITRRRADPLRTVNTDGRTATTTAKWMTAGLYGRTGAANGRGTTWSTGSGCGSLPGLVWHTASRGTQSA